MLNYFFHLVEVFPAYQQIFGYYCDNFNHPNMIDMHQVCLIFTLTHLFLLFPYYLPLKKAWDLHLNIQECYQSLIKSNLYINIMLKHFKSKYDEKFMKGNFAHIHNLPLDFRTLSISGSDSPFQSMYTIRITSYITNAILI